MLNRDDRQGERLVQTTPEMYLWVRRTAYICARRAGMTREECEDCAGDCLLRVMNLADAGVLHPQQLSRAWLFRCVDNYASNFARSNRRRRFREITLPYNEFECDSGIYPIDESALPEVGVIRRELMLRICIALACLSAADQRLFRVRCLDGIPYAEAAAAVNRTPGALREAVRALRKRLQMVLACDGLAEEELADYLQLLAPHPRGRRTERRLRSE